MDIARDIDQHVEPAEFPGDGAGQRVDSLGREHVESDVLLASSPSSLPASTSVAMTVASSPMKAVAIARPMPCPAAVTSATLFFSRPAMGPLACSVAAQSMHIGAQPITT